MKKLGAQFIFKGDYSIDILGGGGGGGWNPCSELIIFLMNKLKSKQFLSYDAEIYGPFTYQYET